MKDDFKIGVAWPFTPEAGERDVAELRLEAGSVPLTRILDLERKEERDVVRASAVSLALWFADNWWRLRHESLPNGFMPSADWRLRHELSSASGGSLWPPVMMHSTGDRVLITPAYGRPLDAGSIRHLLPDVASVSGAGFESGLDAFFDRVLAHCVRALDGSVLAGLVEALAQERSDPDMAAWRRLEARLGYDPDQVPPALIRAFERLACTVGEAGADEAAAAEPGARSAYVLQNAIDAAKASEVIAELAIAKDVSRTRIREQSAPPWQLAREAAYQVRQLAGIPDGPISNAKFAELVGSREEDLRKPGTARLLPYGVRLEGKQATNQIALHAASQRDRRFEMACVLGDRVWDTSSFGVVSKAKTDRQKFQRAFAQNLLVPYADLRPHIDISDLTEDEIERAAKQFKVHPNVIKRLLMLENVLPEETFEERLEAA